jgi:aminoglycoside phosphotransferase (APT) family kinase protein
MSPEVSELARCASLLEAIAYPGDRQILSVAPLRGGVSSDIFLVQLAERQLCIKFANEQLRVAGNWRAPVRRSLTEFRWLTFVGEHCPGAVPKLLGYSERHAGFAMEYLPEQLYPNWKAELLRGHVSAEFATLTGSRLARIHSLSTAEPTLATIFATQQDFGSLRLDPYFHFTAARHPQVRDRLCEIADALPRTQLALVHGDISPKNILIGSRGPIFLDAECAVFGDPAFDIAFCLNHLVIKALCRDRDRAALLRAIDALWSGYCAGVDWEDALSIEKRTARILPALMLARVDGKSPVEYLTSTTANILRREALALLRSGLPTVAEVRSAIQENIR